MSSSLFGHAILEQIEALCQHIAQLPREEAIEILNAAKVALHRVSPFQNEPTDCVLWVKAEEVQPNNYNPNRFAPPEIRGLELSIERDGYTQPIVVFSEESKKIVVDGQNRHHIGHTSKAIARRLWGYVPITFIRPDRQGRADRIASTIGHNRFRGEHDVEEISKLVRELSQRNWSDEKIARELGMDADEVLRLKQIRGLAELFADREFSQAWGMTDEPGTPE
jgi:ParB-like chromosome segregation protein Spo0J